MFVLPIMHLNHIPFSTFTILQEEGEELLHFITVLGSGQNHAVHTCVKVRLRGLTNKDSFKGDTFMSLMTNFCIAIAASICVVNVFTDSYHAVPVGETRRKCLLVSAQHKHD